VSLITSQSQIKATTYRIIPSSQRCSYIVRSGKKHSRTQIGYVSNLN